MKTRYFIILICTLLLGASSFFFFANSGRKEKTIAYVLNGEVFDGFDLTKEKAKELEAVQNTHKAILDSMNLQLQVFTDAFRKTKSPGEQQIMQGRQMQQQLMMRQQQFTQDEEKLKASFNTEIWKQLNQYVTEYGKANGYAYILGASGDGSLMYAEEQNNLTKEVVAYINKKYKGVKG